MKSYLVKEPTRDPYEGYQMILARDNFNADVDDASIVVALNEGRNEELRAGLRTLDESYIAERRHGANTWSYHMPPFRDPSRKLKN